jgi:hypothetical protein
MLQVDPRRRPRVEELESMPALEPHMHNARRLSTDFRQQQVKTIHKQCFVCNGCGCCGGVGTVVFSNYLRFPCIYWVFYVHFLLLFFLCVRFVFL